MSFQTNSHNDMAEEAEEILVQPDEVDASTGEAQEGSRPTETSQESVRESEPNQRDSFQGVDTNISFPREKKSVGSTSHQVGAIPAKGVSRDMGESKLKREERRRATNATIVGVKASNASSVADGRDAEQDSYDNRTEEARVGAVPVRRGHQLGESKAKRETRQDKRNASSSTDHESDAMGTAGAVPVDHNQLGESKGKREPRQRSSTAVAASLSRLAGETDMSDAKGTRKTRKLKPTQRENTTLGSESLEVQNSVAQNSSNIPRRNIEDPPAPILRSASLLLIELHCDGEAAGLSFEEVAGADIRLDAEAPYDSSVGEDMDIEAQQHDLQSSTYQDDDILTEQEMVHSNSTVNNDALIEEEMTHSPTIETPHEDILVGPPPGDALLIEATPLSAEDADLQEAEAVDPEVLIRRQDKKRNDRRKLYRQLCLLVACAVIIGVAILLAVLLPEEPTDTPAGVEEDSTARPTTDEPSPTPSSAPTVLMEDLPNYTVRALEDPFSPQSKAFDWLIEHPNLSSLDQWRREQLFALVTFFYAFDGEAWPDLVKNDWLVYDKHECDWFSSEYVDSAAARLGVFFGINNVNVSTCDASSRFQTISLSGLGRLQAFLPQELSLLTSLENLFIQTCELNMPLVELVVPSDLLRLPNLTRIAMDSNGLTGIISPELGMMTSLRMLDFRSNAITGIVPSGIGLLSELEFLGLGYNRLSGSVPSEIGLLTALKVFSFNSETPGTFPSALFALTALTSLMLTDKNMIGTIPSQIGLLTSMKVLMTIEAPLTGALPEELFLLSDLWTLWLTTSSLSGSLSTRIGQLTNLLTLWLAGPTYVWDGTSSSVGLTGRLPVEIAQMSTLAVFTIHGNSFSGLLPDFSRMRDLQGVDIFRNPLTGTLQADLGLNPGMKSIQISRTLVSGTVPSEFGLLSGLEILNFENGRLTGTLPPEVLGIPTLEHVSFASQLISGVIPSEIGLLTSLRFIDFAGNSLTGSIPTEIGNIRFIPGDISGFLELEQNLLSGPIPSEIGSLSVFWLDLSENDLSGTIPTEVGTMHHFHSNIYLQYGIFLWLSNNLITGSIPSELGAVQTVWVELHRNALTGRMPSEIGKLSDLSFLSAHSNAISGRIPVEISLCTSLEWLNIAKNLLRGPIPSQMGFLSTITAMMLGLNHGLNGTLPTELMLLTRLSSLGIYSTSVSGTIPENIGYLTDLELLYFDNNTMVGTLPAEFGALTKLEELDVAFNRMTGTIPSSLGSLLGLRWLALNDNSLFGHVPLSLTQMRRLETLRLGLNSLSGGLMSEVGMLTSLTSLSMQSNPAMTGSLPTQLGLLWKLTSLELQDMASNGTIPSTLGLLSNLEILSLAMNELTGPIPDELGFLTSIKTLNLSFNTLTGTIPDSLGLPLDPDERSIYLQGNSLSGSVPSGLCPWLCNGLGDSNDTSGVLDVNCSDVSCNYCICYGILQWLAAGGGS